jgi:hypothetical protein
LSDGHVVGIDLEGGNANCTIPKALAQFPALTRIGLSDMNLFGTIPPELFTDLNLNYFRVSSNSLEGSIPSTVAQATSMTNFQVETNRLTGTVPAGMENLPALRALSLYRNRLSCPFPIALYNAMAQRNASFCLMNGNSWDSALNGKLCNSDTLLSTPHRSACTIGPFPGSAEGRTGTPDYSFETATNHFEIRGSEILLFLKLSNGTAFKEEYLSMRVYGVNLYDEVTPASLGKPPSVANWYSLPINRFSNFTQIERDVYELSTYFVGEPIHTFTLTIYGSHESVSGYGNVVPSRSRLSN